MGGHAKMKAFCFIVGILTGSPSFATIIHAGASRAFTNITAAIATAANGDTVLVDQGFYKEQNLVIRKSIVLLGINHPVLDGEKKY